MQHDNDRPQTGKGLLAALATAVLAVSMLGGCGAAGYLDAFQDYMDDDYLSKPQATILGAWEVEAASGSTRYVFTPEGTLRITAARDGLDEILVDGTYAYDAEANHVRCADALGNGWQCQVRFLDPDHLVLTHEDGREILLARR